MSPEELLDVAQRRLQQHKREKELCEHNFAVLVTVDVLEQVDQVLSVHLFAVNFLPVFLGCWLRRFLKVFQPLLSFVRFEPAVDIRCERSQEFPIRHHQLTCFLLLFAGKDFKHLFRRAKEADLIFVATSNLFRSTVFLTLRSF